jgi:hypothetical protein
MRPHQARLNCPCGTTKNAASSGPSDDPVLPPTWNTDCARPWRPPDDIRAMRDDSGWKIDEPTPISPTASRIAPSVLAIDSSSRPDSENTIPATSEYGIGRRSVYIPTSGCSSDAVSCSVNVISPICEKLSCSDDLSSG